MASLPSSDTEPISLGSFSWSFVLYIVKLQRRFRQMRERRETKRIAAMEAEREATASTRNHWLVISVPDLIPNVLIFCGTLRMRLSLFGR
jgi:hypothetical protein